MIHVAGESITVNQRLRQRCSWCGAILEEVDLTRTAVLAEDADKPFPTWPAGRLISQEGGVTFVVGSEDDTSIPVGCCMSLDPEVTT